MSDPVSQKKKRRAEPEPAPGPAVPLCPDLCVPAGDARYAAFLALPVAARQDYLLAAARLVEALAHRPAWEEPGWCEQLRGRVEVLCASLSDVRKNPRDQGRWQELCVSRSLDRACRTWGGELSDVHVEDTAALVHQRRADLIVRGRYRGHEVREVWVEIKSNGHSRVGSAAVEALVAKVTAAPAPGPLVGAVLYAEGAVAHCSSLPELRWAGRRPVVVLSHQGAGDASDLLALVVRFLLVAAPADAAAGAAAAGGPGEAGGSARRESELRSQVESFTRQLRDTSAVLTKQAASLRLAEKHLQAARQSGEGLLGALQARWLGGAGDPDEPLSSAAEVG